VVYANKEKEIDEEIKKYGEVASVKQNIDENFDQTRPMIDITVPKETFFI
jgi:aminoglycoside phosphotransferase family enzyme